ncbi:protein kinase [Candidatus Uabimicrobium sp. HlEnr_7]|uniref:protein kinase domain-containing protein n=1 Tax=Candidatus Uabimicrobium helgolandensis TaxID=3095367 RepID=UPI003558CBB3
MTKTIGQYKILDKLGEGGMGTVHLAYDDSIKRKVAIKHINDRSSYYVKRMMREAQSIASLTHPNIIRVYNVLMIQNFPCLVMEYIDGVTLHEYLPNNTLSLEEKIKLFIKILEAVESAHKVNIVHRDIKPANIMIDQQGEPHLMDFGLAKRMKVDATLTKTGLLIGSPNYMSPEQANGETRKLDHLSDLYSLGTIFYELITDLPVIADEKIMDILRKVIYEKPMRLREIDPNASYDLESICYKALQKKKRHRYQSAQGFADDLNSFLSQQTPTATFWRMRSGFFKILNPLCLILVLLAVLFWSKERKDTINLRITSPQTLLQNAFNLIDYGLDEDAFKQLTSLEQRLSTKSPLRQKMYLGMLEIYKRQKKWVEVEKIATRYFRGKNVLQADLALAYMFFEKGNIDKAQLHLKHKVRTSNSLATDFYYLKAKLFYEEKKYEETISSLLQSLKATDQSSLQRTKTKEVFIRLLLGKTYFQSYLKSKKNIHLQQAKGILFSLEKQLTNNAEVYEYIGRCLFVDHLDLEQAKAYFQKSIDLKPGRARYYNLLAEVHIALKDFSKAYSCIIEAVKLDPRNNIASTSFIELAYQNPQQQQEYYMTMTYYSKNFDKIAVPDCIKNKVIQLKAKFQESYERLQWWREKHNSKQLNIQKSFFGTPDQFRTYLNLVRHHNDMETTIKDYISKEFSDSEHKFFDILETFINKKQREIKKANYYRLAQWYENNDREMVVDWTQQEFASIDKQNLRAILENDKEKLIMRYLAAKALLNSQDTHYVENYLTTTKSSIGRLIACLAYRSESVAVSISPIVSSLSKTTFLLKLLSINYLYLPGEHIDSATLSLLQEFMLPHNKQIVRMYAAKVVFSIKNAPRELWLKAENIFLKCMDDKNVENRFFAHYYFWQNDYVKQRIKDYWEYYHKAWQEQYEPIISTMIFFAKEKILDKKKSKLIAQYMAQHIEKKRQEGKKINVSRLQATKVLFYHLSPPKRLLEQPDEHPIPRVLAYNSEIFKRASNSWNPNKVLQNMRFIKKILRRTQSEEQDKYYKIFVYYISALFGFHTLDSFEKENEATKSHILQHLCFLKFGFMKNFQNPGNALTKYALKTLNKEIGDNWSRDQKLQLIKKYINSDKESLRRNALMAWYVYSDKKQQQQIFNSYLLKSQQQKKMLAVGIHNLVKLMTFSRFLAPKEIQSLQTQYYLYLTALQNKSKRRINREILRHLDRAIQLDPLNMTYKFEKAVAQVNFKQISQSVKIWEEIVNNRKYDSQKESFISRLKLAEYYIQNYDGEQATKKMKMLFGAPVTANVLARDKTFVLRVARAYAMLGMWKQARTACENIFFSEYSSKKTLFISSDDLNENDEARVRRYFAYF